MFPYTISDTVNGIRFDDYVQSIVIGPDSYYLNVINGTFSYNFTKTLQLPIETAYLTMIYDGSDYIYVYPFVGNTICRFNINRRISLFIPFCLNTSLSSCGSVYFDNTSELVLKGTGNGTVYAVRYNILRVQNGMAGILYA